MSSAGTLMSWDALHQSSNTILQLGEANVYETLKVQLAAHNAQLQSVLSDFVEVVNDDVRGEYQYDIFGDDDVIYLDPIAEQGLAEASKTTTGDTVGFPIESFARSVQWTKLAFEMLTGREFTRQFDAIRKGNAIQVRNKILTCLFTPTNSTVVDRLTNGQTLSVKALTNADSGFIPPNSYGTTFNSASHTHYLTSAALDTAAMDAQVTALVEHYVSGTPRIYINRAQEATVKGLSKFLSYQDVRVIQAITADHADTPLVPLRLENRAIGLYDGVAEVWTKPWMPSGYIFGTMLGQRKPVRMRQRRGGLYLATEYESYPLRARMLQHEYGCGILERTNGVVTQITGGSYTAPTFS